MSIGGLDIGTTGCKITVYDNKGTYLCRSYVDYATSRTGKHEADAGVIWESVKHVIRDASSKVNDIESIGITSFGESFAMLDEQDKPLFPVMLYTDPRGPEECRELVSLLGKDAIQYITGLKPHSCYTISKLMWVKKHYPDVYSKTRKVLLMADYITYMLTGNAVIDYSVASRSMAFDIRKMEWNDLIFDAAGIDKSLFSKPVIGGTSAGPVKKAIAEELGLKKDVIIVPAGHDQVAASIGAGVFSVNYAVDSAGSVECVTPVFDSIPENDLLYKGCYAIVPYVEPGRYVTYAFSFTGGELIRWYINTFAKEETARAKATGTTVYSLLEQDMKDEPTGILVLPHFAGAATPYMDEGSKGAVVGLTVGHNISDIYRAMMEGVVYEMRLNIENLKEAGVYINRLHAAGGGANSRIWNQMKADILNIPIVTLASHEAGATGCVLMAGITAKIFSDVESAKALLIKEKDVYYPRKEQHEKYSEYYEKYKRLYNAVRPLV